MTFLEKLEKLMNEHNLNKSTLSKSCGIPYTTIDGWYKKGFEDMRLSTLKKLAAYFNTTLDFWAYDNDDNDSLKLSKEKQEFITNIIDMDNSDFNLVSRIVDSVLDKNDLQPH